MATRSMKADATFFQTLLGLFRRDGFSFFAKCFRHAFSADAWRWLLRDGKSARAGRPARKRRPSRGRRRRASPSDVALVRSSPLFDPVWYLKRHPRLVRARIDPAEHYVLHGLRPDVNPGPDFIGDEYLALNTDIRTLKRNPLVHFERYGRKENRLVSFLQERRTSYPPDAVESEFEYPPDGFRVHGRIAVFAAHSGSARIPETTLCYLRGLKSVVDDIVFVSSNPVLPEEAGKLRGLVRVAVFRDHGGYDFYSYKIGWKKAEALGLLASRTVREVVLANDSCFAPVFPFANCFAGMSDRACDFWGMSAHSGFVETAHVQSYFLVFRRPVLDDGSLGRFLDDVGIVGDRWDVIRRYEAGLTAALVAAGHAWDTLVPRGFSEEHDVSPTKRPLETMESFGMPLVKIRSMNGDMDDDREEVLGFIRAKNPELASAIPPAAPPPDYGILRRLRESMPASFKDKIAAIRNGRVAAGLPVRAVFIVCPASGFPARPLFEAVRGDSRFDARIVVVPDCRAGAGERQRACFAELADGCPAGSVSMAEKEPDGVWPDLLGGADVVFYPFSGDVSSFRYNPHWAVGRPFLPILAAGPDSAASDCPEFFWDAFDCERAGTEKGGIGTDAECSRVLNRLLAEFGLEAGLPDLA